MFLHRNPSFQTIVFLNCCFFLLTFHSAHSQSIYQSLTVMSSQGNQYSPIVISAQLISSTMTNSFQLCATACNANTLCRVFDFGAIISQQCRLFEGDTGTLGAIVSSSRSDSIVGSIQITPSLFAQYSQSCSSMCAESRYLVCVNSTCQCTPRTYWNSSAGICLPQSPILGASCQQGMKMCREDLNYTCLQFNQCGPLSVLSGTTIADQNTTIKGSSVVGIQQPYGVTIYGVGENESLVIVDQSAAQLVHIQNVNSNNRTVSSIVLNITSGTGFNIPNFAFIDIRNRNDLYVSDYGWMFVVLFSSIQMNNPPPRVVAGVNKTNGAALYEINGPAGLAVDQQQNLYIADFNNHRIMRWAPNATAGVIIAGTGTAGSDLMSLNEPNGIFLDQDSSLLYVADFLNHRIQVFHLSGTPLYNGTTVAGGNGPGSSGHQLNGPSDVWVSKKTGSIYIVDLLNHRLQRWSKGATAGVSIAGSPGGSSGSSATMFNTPHGLVINVDETSMYVSDTSNKRVQRFDLI